MIEPLVKTAAAISLLLVNGATEASIFEYVGELPGSVSVSYDFGRAVATDGVTVAVSSLNRDSTLGTPGGAGYVFAPDSGALVNRLGDNTASTADAYGWSIAIHGERTLIGAPRGATQPDTAYLFDHSTGAVVKKLAGDVRSENSFGRSLAMDQGLAIVGSPRERISPTEFGAAYVFNASDGARVLKITSGAAPSSSSAPRSILTEMSH